MKADPLQKPPRALRPTTGKIVAAAICWPAMSIANASLCENPKRAIAYAVMNVVLFQFALLTVLIWCSIRLALYFTSNLYLEIALVIVLLTPLRFLMPIVTILTMPVALAVGFLLQLIFPLRTTRDRLQK